MFLEQQIRILKCFLKDHKLQIIIIYNQNNYIWKKYTLKYHIILILFHNIDIFIVFFSVSKSVKFQTYNVYVIIAIN